MIDAAQVKEHMEIVGSDGAHVGTVDECEGDRIKLTKKDPAARGEHHYLMLGDVDRVDGGRLCLKHSAAEAMQRWQQG